MSNLPVLRAQPPGERSVALVIAPVRPFPRLRLRGCSLLLGVVLAATLLAVLAAGVAFALMGGL